MRDSGTPNQESELAIGLVAPAGAPATVVALLQKEIARIIVLPDVKSMLDKFSFSPVGSMPSQFASQIKNDIVAWRKVMKDADIPVN